LLNPLLLGGYLHEKMRPRPELGVGIND
jgi:hypothetical protein